MGIYLDKWNIGPLRMVNLVALAVVFYWLRKPVLRLVAVEPFLTLGKASLEVFFAHIIFVFIGLALLYGEVTELQGYPARPACNGHVIRYDAGCRPRSATTEGKTAHETESSAEYAPPAASIKQFAE